MSLEFWIIMAVLVLGGSCSMKGTWWERKPKKPEEKAAKK